MQRAEQTAKLPADKSPVRTASEPSTPRLGIDDSPRVVMQRQQLDALFGNAVPQNLAPPRSPNRTGLPDSSQMQPRVGINDDPCLAQEAYRMGHQTAQLQAGDLRRTGTDRERATHSGVGVMQLARIVKQPIDGTDQKDEYVVVDVPADGACLIHSFNLTHINQDIVPLFRRRPPGEVTAQMVEDTALKMFRAMSGQPTPLAAFQAKGLESRDGIARQWRGDIPGHQVSLKSDIQAVVHAFLEPQGLLGRKEAVRDPSLQDASQSSVAPVSSDAKAPPVTDDFDFVFDAVYFPERARRESPASARSGTQVDRSMFAITEAELRAMPIPMGVVPGGTLATEICDYILALARPGMVGQYLPMHALILPPPVGVPLSLVGAYIDEFAVNTSLWASETALATLSEMKNTRVDLHSFDDEDEHVGIGSDFPGTEGHLDLYQAGTQSHFQAMFGPFPPGFLKDGAVKAAHGDMSAQPSPTRATGVDFFTAGSTRHDADDDMSDSGLARIFEGTPTYFDPADCPALSSEDLGWISSVINALGQDFGQPGDVVELVYRAAAMLGRDDIFSGTPAAAAGVVEKYQAMQEQGSEGASAASHESQRREPIIPLAGLVPELIDCGIPASEMDRLLPHARNYLAFHQKRPSWKAKDARPRVQALQAMAAILNEWAKTYDQPRLRRGPSIAEHTTVQSPLARHEVVGVNMRALLTIDPGGLVGFEPEESQTWVTFREALQGFVRAHVLNKHLGGPGTSDNIGYLSSADNTRMSQLGEEYVKKEVIENGKQIFFGVEMPLGRPDLTQSPHFLSPDIAGMLANQVSMRVGEVSPFQNEKDENDLEFRNVFLRDALGVKDPDVTQDNAGGLRFKAGTPSADSLSKINANHSKRLRTEEGKASNMSLDSFSLPDGAQLIVIDAQRHLRNNPSLQARKDILESVQKQLAGKVSAEDIALQMRKLAEVGRQAATLASTHEKKAGKEALHMKNPVRVSFITQHKLGEGQAKQVAGMTENMFDRARTLMAHGAKVHEALNVQNLRDPKYSELLAALKKAKQGGGIGAYFV